MKSAEESQFAGPDALQQCNLLYLRYGCLLTARKPQSPSPRICPSPSAPPPATRSLVFLRLVVFGEESQLSEVSHLVPWEFMDPFLGDSQ